MPAEDNLLNPHVSLLTHNIRAWAITSSEQSTFHYRLVEKRSLARSVGYNHDWGEKKKKLHQFVTDCSKPWPAFQQRLFHMKTNDEPGGPLHVAAVSMHSQLS